MTAPAPRSSTPPSPLLLSRGHDQTTAEQVAETAGVSPARAFLRYLGNIEDLLS